MGLRVNAGATAVSLTDLADKQLSRAFKPFLPDNIAMHHLTHSFPPTALSADIPG